MKAIMKSEKIKTITTHYIDGAFVESHGREVMDVIKPTNGQLIGRVMLGDEEDTRRAIAAAKRAFASFGRTTKDERSRYLRQLHMAVSARIDDLTAVMIEEYGGVARFARLIVESGVNAFAAAPVCFFHQTFISVVIQVTACAAPCRSLPAFAVGNVVRGTDATDICPITEQHLLPLQSPTRTAIDPPYG